MGSSRHRVMRHDKFDPTGSTRHAAASGVDAGAMYLEHTSRSDSFSVAMFTKLCTKNVARQKKPRRTRQNLGKNPETN